ncbi:calmodulin-binding receptor-like cytoplasmic kinase 3 isoform X2 [Rhodamnia argentea]|uniref:non-specific serine/threonine protein kinase n=1 Tax=Rhodamnia argentea TaxID=178133 RepID=A0A8B8QNH3_9MYRT|nr:calmodulin-binding receptor-like cytoplasmic kinase 3 isoform X2 [Rhodamnia argentea]
MYYSTMAIAATILLLLPQLLRIAATDFHLKSKVCGSDRLEYASYSGSEFFYINEEIVDQTQFCNALKYHYEDGCDLEDYPGPNCSGINLSLVRTHFHGGRKFLQTEVSVDKVVEQSQEKEEKKSRNFPLTHKSVSLVVPGVLALSCVLVCPCLYRKKKEAAQTVLPKDMNSVNSTPLSEESSAPEKVSPPEKIPGSPLRVPPSPSRFSMSPKLSRLGSLHLSLNQILKATRNFSPSMQIGEGGFGTVYKAQLEGGQFVAIKRAKKEHFESLRTEFSCEVQLLSKIDHRSLVKLLGYIEKGNERLIITEYLPNGTLREHLDGQHGRILDFNQRLEVAIDVAHGLTYLHLYSEKQIIHRDVKSSNILLTDSMRAKVADFGFARLGAGDTDKTHVSTKVKGTVGYLDPEYMRTYQLTTKSDVYSFGILLIEILTGRRPVDARKPVDERVTIRWAFRKFNEGNVVDLMDPRMEQRVDRDILMRIFSLAFQCAAPGRSDRPDMNVVGEELWGIRVDYLKSVRGG